MDTFDSGATSSYSGLILDVRKQLSKGVSADANYTWSHYIGDLTIGNSTALTAGGSGLVTTFGAANFGHITSALDPRIVQLALKYVF
jgi:hypothetical protein